MAEESQTEDRFPRVTQAQLQLWLADPTTQKYFQCLQWTIDNCKAELGTAQFIDPHDANRTQFIALSISATQEAIAQMITVRSVLNHYNMLENPSEEETDDDD